jgi:hypothetical protein
VTHVTEKPGRLGTLLIDRSLWTDVAVGAVLLGAFLGWALTTKATARDATLPPSTRSAIYISVAATSGALLGFVITALSVLLALPSGRRLGFLRGSKAWPKFPGVFVRAAWVLGAATVVSTAAIVIDDNAKPSTVTEGFGIGAASSAVLRVAACVLLLGRLVQYSFEDRGVAETANETNGDP